MLEQIRRISLYPKFKTMLLTKVDLLHNLTVSNITTLRLNLDKITILQARANYKTKFKLIKVKLLKGLTSNPLRIRCESRSIIIMGRKLTLNSAIQQLWFIILIQILGHILKMLNSITTDLTKNLKLKWEGITQAQAGSRNHLLIWLRIIILSSLIPTGWPWVVRFYWMISFRANIIFEVLVKKWKLTVLYKLIVGPLPKQVFKLKR